MFCTQHYLDIVRCTFTDACCKYLRSLLLDQSEYLYFNSVRVRRGIFAEIEYHFFDTKVVCGDIWVYFFLIAVVVIAKEKRGVSK